MRRRTIKYKTIFILWLKKSLQEQMIPTHKTLMEKNFHKTFLLRMWLTKNKQ